MGEQHTLRIRFHVDFGCDLVGTAADTHSDALGHRRGVGVVRVAVSRRLRLRTWVTELFDCSAVVEGQHEVVLGFLEPGVDEFLEFLGVLLGEVGRLRTVLFDVV
jgi:hypothetical protein